MQERSSRFAAAVSELFRQHNSERQKIFLFTVFSLLWIPGADWLYASVLAGESATTALQVLKGVVYVGVLLLFLPALVRRPEAAAATCRKESPEFFRKTVEAMNEVVLVTDNVGELRYVCPNVERVTGIPPAQLRAAGSARAVFGEDPGAALAGGESTQVRNVIARIAADDGGVRELLVNVHRCDIDGDSRLYVGRSFSNFDLAESVMHRIFWHSQDPIVFVSAPDRVILNCNPATTELFGYPREELIGQSTQRLHCGADGYERYGSERLRGIAGRGYVQTDYRLQHRSGRTIDADIRTVWVSEKETGGGYISIIHDVTARRAAERAVKTVQDVVRGISGCTALEEAYRPILEAFCEHSGWAVGEAWVPTEAGFERLAEAAASADGLDYLVRSADRHAAANDKLLAGSYRSKEPDCIDDIRSISESSSQIAAMAAECGMQCASTVPLVADGSVHAVLAFFSGDAPVACERWLVDVSAALSPFAALVARVSSEQHLRIKEREANESRESLRKLALRLEDLREAERKALARELHDQMGADVTALKIQLGLAGAPGTGDSERQAQLDAAKGVVNRMAENVRSMATRLRPAVLDDCGLAAGLEWLVAQFAAMRACTITLTVDPGFPRLTENQVTALYRVCQESLTNILRHADARNAEVHLCSDDNTVVLSVSDDGRGLAETTQDGYREGLGIIGMRERLRAVGGVLDVQPRDGSGTCVRATMPLFGEQSAATLPGA